MYGANEDLHSKATQVLRVMMNLEQTDEVKKERLHRTLRFIAIKLFNSIDTSKQLPIIETVHSQLIASDDEGHLNEENVFLGLTIFHDFIKLKLGRRVSHVAVISLVETFNYLMTKKQAIQLKNEFKPETL